MQPAPNSTIRIFACILALLSWGAFVVRSYQVFGPDSVYVQPFNSDSALPVLMANDKHVDAFRTYVYGQDQIGAWPFLFAQFVRRAVGVTWTPFSIYLMQVLWLSLGLLLVALLCSEAAALVAALFAATLTLHPTVSHYFFVLNQRNAWQVTAIMFAWVFLRKVCEGQTRTTLWWAGAFLFSFLAIWTAPVSTPILCVVYALELLRSRILAKDGAAQTMVSLTSLVKSFLPIAAAIVLEQLLKANYHRFATKHFGSDFRTPTELDWGNILINFQKQTEVFFGVKFWWLAAIGMLAGIALGYYLLRSVGAKTVPPICRPGLRLDLCVLVCGCSFAAILSFVIPVPFTWIRLNAYGPRYLAQPHMFGVLACLFFLVLLMTLSSAIYKSRRLIFSITAVVVAVLIVVRFPARRLNAEYNNMREVARTLAQTNSHVVVLGGYWDTYVLAALAPPEAITAVPADDQLLRTPWAPEVMRESEKVLVVHHPFAFSGAVETPGPYETFGDGANPPAVLTQRGVTLRLETPRWLEKNGYRFSLYQNTTFAK